MNKYFFYIFLVVRCMHNVQEKIAAASLNLSLCVLTSTPRDVTFSHDLHRYRGQHIMSSAPREITNLNNAFHLSYCFLR
jgi:hypothetical protein